MSKPTAAEVKAYLEAHPGVGMHEAAEAVAKHTPFRIKFIGKRFDEIAAIEELDETDLFLRLYPGDLDRINKCVNMHEELLEALKFAYESACSNQDSAPSKEVFLKMRNAIERATGGGE